MSSDTELYVGVCGGSASGKTTICNDIAKYFGREVQIITQDSYYIDRSELTEEEINNVNFDHPSSVDINQMYMDIITLKEYKEVWIPQYCFKTHSVLKSKVRLGTRKINIIEGLFVLENEKLRNLFDLKIYIHADDDLRLMRRIKRDMEQRARCLQSILDQYLYSVKPMHEQYVVKQKSYADYILDTSNSSETETRVESLVSQLKALIS